MSSYTPPFSRRATVSIRRLAWFLQIPMTSTIERVVNMLPAVVDPELVCGKCRDNSRCKDCSFNGHRLGANNHQLADYLM